MLNSFYNYALIKLLTPILLLQTFAVISISDPEYG